MRKTIYLLIFLFAIASAYIGTQNLNTAEPAVLTADINDNTTALKKKLEAAIIPVVSSDELEPTVAHKDIIKEVIRKTSYDHFSRRKLDKELSALAFDRFLEMLDGSKQYFLDSDIKEFSNKSSRFHSALKAHNPSIAFDIFKRYQERARNRLQYSLDLMDEQPALDSNELYQFDREQMGWSKSAPEWDKLWRHRVTNDVINQFLADKDWEEIQKTLKTRYTTALRQVDQQQPDDVFQLFMNAYIDSLDPHSGYYNPKNEDERNIQSSLTYSGIGASLSIQDEYVTVGNIIPGGPAEITELVKIDDRIIGVGQENESIQEVFGWRLDDVVQLIRGPINTEVSLRILREQPGSGEREIEIVLERNQIKLEAQAAKKEIIELERNGNTVKMGVITIPSFYQDYRGKWAGDKDYKSTTKDVLNIINELESDNIQGLVIDLRNNGGGNLEEAITLSGLFINEGPIVQFRSNPYRKAASYNDSNELTDIAYTGPLTVLVNRYSASASEIFAAAIQDYQRGVIIGQTTFGKGTVQEQIPLDGPRVRIGNKQRYGLLSLTIGKFYRINGGSTQHRGVIPDIVLPDYIDPSEVGESSEKSALAWDQIEIEENYYHTTDDIDKKLIDQLAVLQNDRAKKDPDMIYLINDIDSIKALRNRKSYSLNLETRKNERESIEQQRLARENDRRKAHGEEMLEDFKALEDADPTDVQLKQTTEILADLINTKNARFALTSDFSDTQKQINDRVN
jgi:carboxyl-terminal processing protease